MKAALILALSLSYATPAMSQTANQAAQQEAKSFFISCKQYPKARRSECEDNQDGFTDWYVSAKGGADISILAVYEGFYSPKPPIGIIQSRRQACAWIIVRGENSADRHEMAVDTFGRICAGISSNEMRAVEERADVLLYELRTRPTTDAPPLDKGLISTVPVFDPPPKATSVQPDAPSLITAMPNIR